MKKIGLALLLFTFCIQLNAQQNTFPTVGNVGIGTTSPTEKLTVNGALKVEQGSILKGEIKMPDIPLVPEGNGQGNNQSENQYKFLVIGEDGIIRRGQIGEFGNPPNPISICDLNTPNQRGRWNSGINKLFTCPPVLVGINNENPRVRLDVKGTSYTNKQVIGNLDPSSIANNLLYAKSYSSFEDNDKVLIFEHAGNYELLSLQNDGLLTTKNILNNGNFTLNATISASSDRVLFTIKNLDRKIIEINNNGLILAREMKLNQTWADYVFEKQYALMPLKEVEAFILKNKHLPNVPSAKEVEENGITVNETNKILLEKVEELTLYLIEQDKKMKTLEQQIDILKNK